MRTRESVSALKLVNKLFTDHKIPYWLEKGTLLGSVRDKQLVPWDDDVDISVPICYMDTIHSIKDKLNDSCFELYYVNGHFCLRHRLSGDHIMCILPHLILKVPWCFFIEYYPPFTWIIDALMCVDYHKETSYIETVSRFKSPIWFRKTWMWIGKHMSQQKRNGLIETIIRLQNTFGLYKTTKDKPNPIPFRYTEMYNTSFPIPIKAENYLEHQFGDWKTPRHKGKIVTEWKGKKYGNK